MNRQVLIVGEPNEPDFQRVIPWLASRSRLSFSKSVSEACERFEKLPPPELIVLLQSRPGQFAAASVEQLHRLWPLARLVMALGSWCEGETRSGKPCPGVWRIYWYDVARRLGGIFDSHYAQTPKSWNLPRSVSEGERLLGDLSDDPQRRHGLVLISAHANDYDALADACRVLGLDTARHLSSDSNRQVGHAPHDGMRLVCDGPPISRGFRQAEPDLRVAGGIWDARLGDESEWAQVRRFAQSIAPAPVVVTLGFPRLEQHEQSADIGLTVLAKPFQLPDLWRALSATVTIDQAYAAADQHG